MEPTTAKIDSIRTSSDPLKAVINWVGLSEDVLIGLRSHLGDFKKLRDIAYMDQEDWNRAKTAVEITADSGKRKLNPLEKGQVGMLRDVACKILNPRSGASSVAGGTGGDGGASGGTDVSNPASGLQPPRKASFKNTIDQSDPTEFVPMKPEDFWKYQFQFEEDNGDMEAEDSEVCTAEQLQAVKLKLDHSYVPYVEFALVRPFSARFQRDMTYVEQVWEPAKGMYTPRKVRGPASYREWSLCYRVVCYILRALRAVDRTRLERYERTIAQLDDKYGGVGPDSGWWAIVQAEGRMRREYMDNTLARLEKSQRNHVRNKGVPAAGPLPDSARPWNTVLAFCRRRIQGLLVRRGEGEGVVVSQAPQGQARAHR